MAHRRSEVVRRVGQRLRELREVSGTQEEVAERAGFSGKYVSEIERGLRDPPLTTLERIAVDGLGCTLEQLVVGANAAQPSGKAAPRQAVPRMARQIVDELAALPDNVRRKAIPVVRGVIALARAAR
jgi:transcriptional regulator with XRE-family HTH domain